MSNSGFARDITFISNIGLFVQHFFTTQITICLLGLSVWLEMRIKSSKFCQSVIQGYTSLHEVLTDF